MIVGAGVIGCYLGKKLGDQEIWEMKKGIVQKPCSGLLSKNVKSTSISIDGLVKNEIMGARFFSESENFEVATKHTQAYVLNRLGLQKRMAQEAEDNGCRILFNKRWNGEKDEYILGADGAGSAVAKAMGIKNRKYVYAYQTYVTLSNRKDMDFVELHLGSFAPNFFGWYIPFDEKHGELAVAGTSQQLNKMFAEFRKKFAVKSVDKTMIHPIPIHDPKAPTVRGNMALIGDAAGQTKATTGGGIIFGTKCADILSKAVAKDDLASYEKEWKNKYEKDLKTHLLISKLAHRNQDYDALLKYINKYNLDKIISEYGDMDHPEVMVKKILRKLLTNPAMIANGLGLIA